MLKLIIYTRFPAVVADLLESHYKRIVTEETADLLGPIEVTPMQSLVQGRVTFPYGGDTSDDPIYTWMTWARNCGLMSSYKLTKAE